MCGIVAFLGNGNIFKILSCLKNLQNRGYDSAGFSYIDDNKIIIHREIYKESIDNLIKLNSNINYKSNFINSIAHTRWATHGEISIVNAHPHISNNKKISLVHNGIIQNYLELKNFLLKNNYTFYSDTDSEVIVNMIQYYYNLAENDDDDNKHYIIVDAINKTLGTLVGTWGLVIQYIDNPDIIYAVRSGSPLLIGKNDNLVIITSETNGFNNIISNYHTLQSNYLYEINVNTTIICDKSIISSPNKNNKGKYLHWMIKEIHDQSHIIQKITNNGSRIKNNNVVFGGLYQHMDKIKSCKNIVLYGCGTSYNACCFAKKFLYELTHFETITIIDASNFNKYDIPKNSDVINLFVSQSGETKDLYDILKLVSGFNIGIVNVVDSLIARTVDCGIYLNIGKEYSVASTKVFTAQVLILVLFGVSLCNNELLVKKYINSIRDLDSLINIELNKELDINYKDYKNYTNGFILGDSLTNIIGNEIALKFKEITYIHMESLSYNTLKHGPLALVTNNNFICILLGDNINSENEIKCRGGKIIKYNITTNNIFNDLLYVIQLQRIIYKIALIKNIDPDYPRNLAKVVTV